ncbi:Peptide methionine sulfoxide reductase MsrA [biofilm metagenome]
MKKIIKNVVLAGCLLLVNGVFAEDAVHGKSSIAIFAGGCFWCMEPPFDVLPGVISTISGYSGGHVDNPTYKEVSNGKTGHFEVVQVSYDPKLISYEKLLEVFWRNIDPFDARGQFCDKGEQYKTVIFYGNDQERQLAEASKQAISAKFPGKNLVTVINPSQQFYPAEDYHQDYYQKNPYKYKFYRFTCGRDQRLNEVWGR